jgi:hypothetical protein
VPRTSDGGNFALQLLRRKGNCQYVTSHRAAQQKNARRVDRLQVAQVTRRQSLCLMQIIFRGRNRKLNCALEKGRLMQNCSAKVRLLMSRKLKTLLDAPACVPVFFGLLLRNAAPTAAVQPLIFSFLVIIFFIL